MQGALADIRGARRRCQLQGMPGMCLHANTVPSMLCCQLFTAVLLHAAEHAQTELRSGLADDHFGKENPSRMEVWKAILEHESNQELLQCIMKCGRAWSSAEKAANM